MGGRPSTVYGDLLGDTTWVSTNGAALLLKTGSIRTRFPPCCTRYEVVAMWTSLNWAHGVPSSKLRRWTPHSYFCDLSRDHSGRDSAIRNYQKSVIRQAISRRQYATLWVAFPRGCLLLFPTSAPSGLRSRKAGERPHGSWARRPHRCPSTKLRGSNYLIRYMN